MEEPKKPRTKLQEQLFGLRIYLSVMAWNLEAYWLGFCRYVYVFPIVGWVLAFFVISWAIMFGLLFL